MANTLRPSFIKSLFGRSRVQHDEAAEQALDEALQHLTRAFDENDVAVQAVRRRQSSGSLKLVSLPAPEAID